MTFTYDVATPAGKVRLLLNDTDTNTAIFSNEEIDAFLSMEGSNIKRAAAQAISTNANNEALASKVLRDKDITTDGAKLADALRKHAAELRAQADADDIKAETEADEGYFSIVGPATHCRPELTGGFWQ